MKYEKELFDFLRENECINEYTHYAKDLLKHCITEDDYIIGVFYWKRTRSGHDYWSNINRKWMKRLNELKKDS